MRSIALWLGGLSLAAATGCSRKGFPGFVVSIESGTAIQAGQLVEFTVSFTDPGDDLPPLFLLDPPPGARFQIISQKHRTSVGRLRWLVGDDAGGNNRLVFRAIDPDEPSVLHQVTVDLRGEGGMVPSGTRFGDVTGDGIADTVAVATQADAGGAADAGAIYVWNGTKTPTGVPDATLTVPGAQAGDRLGAASGQGFQLADVDGDGILDVVAGASSADVGGAADAGAVYVWKGGAALSGAVGPSATLTIPGATAGDQLGLSSGQSVALVDVTGDGVFDVVAGASNADVGGAVDAGAVLVWQGGAALTGTPAPLATLAIPGAVNGDQLGFASGQGVQFADVDGDGIADVVATAQLADAAGGVDCGAIYVWSGGAALAGAPAPRAPQ
jgi:hypothetical protein